MSELQGRYSLPSTRTDHDRLRMLSEICDLQSRGLLHAAGLASGHALLEIGCGLGYISRWASSQGARVTGLDLSDEHLKTAQRLAEEERLLNIRWRHASIYDHELAEGDFDYTYGRAILIHLNQPIDAMRKLFALLKPGGVMVCEEPVIDSIYSEPPNSGYSRHSRLMQELSAACKVDYGGGQRLHLWAKEAGFEIAYVNAYQPLFLTGPKKRFCTWTLEAVGPRLVSERIVTEQELRDVLSAMTTADEDPNVIVACYRFHQMIARRPG